MSQTNLGTDFYYQATVLAKEFGLDAKEIESAYASKPVSLTAHFHAADEAKDMRLYTGAATCVALIVFWPVAFVGGYFLYQNHKKLQAVGDTIRAEISQSKNAPKP